MRTFLLAILSVTAPVVALCAVAFGCGAFAVPEPTAKTAVQAAQVACRAAGYDSLDECAAGLAERVDSPKGAPDAGL